MKQLLEFHQGTTLGHLIIANILSNLKLLELVLYSHIERYNLAGVYSEPDRVPCRKIKEQASGINSQASDLDAQLNYTKVQSKCNNHDRHVHAPNVLLPTTEQMYQHVEKPPQFSTTLATNKVATTNKIAGYSKSTYAVLVGNCVKVYSTRLFVSLPHHNKFMVKERIKETNKVKLALISDVAQRCVAVVVIPLTIYKYYVVIWLHIRIILWQFL